MISKGGTLRLVAKRRSTLIAFCLVLMVLGFTLGNTTSNRGRGEGKSAGVDKLGLGKVGLSFEPNAGQTDPSVRFIAHAPGGTLFFTPAEVVLVLSSLQPTPSKGLDSSYTGKVPGLAAPSEAGQAEAAPLPAVMRLQFEGANPSPNIQAEAGLPGKVNYVTGNDPSKWQTNLPTYSGVVYRSLYSGVDLSYVGAGGSLKGTYSIAPGTDTSHIRWRYEGADKVWLDEKGNLQIRLTATAAEAATVTEQLPVAWQEIGGRRTAVPVSYLVGEDQSVRFAVGKYDKTYPLTIDPMLVYSTYLGGSGPDYAWGIAVDGAGSAYITGQAYSLDFPTQNAYQPTNHGGGFDVFVTKLSPDGSELVYSTYLGGNREDDGWGIAVDEAGSAYVAGITYSFNFPTQDPYQPTCRGCDQSSSEAFVTKLSPDGSELVYSTFLGGSANDVAYGIAVDGSGNAYVTGYTGSADFPLLNPYQLTNHNGDAFVTKLSPDGSELVYSTFLGGHGGEEGVGISLDAAGSAYIAGLTSSTDFPTQDPFQPACDGCSTAYPWNNEAFITKLSPDGSELVYSTYLGGSSNDAATGIAVDSSGNAYVTGYTVSADFPLENPYQSTCDGCDSSYYPYTDNAFVAKLNSSGSALVYSSYLGGSGDDNGWGIAVDGAGDAYVTGDTHSPDFPIQNAYQSENRDIDAFVTKLSPDGSALLYSTFLGGSAADWGGRGIALDGANDAYVVGMTQSLDFPTQNPYQATFHGSWDAFVTKLTSGEPPTSTPTNTPTYSPTDVPSGTPTDTPSNTPTLAPTLTPTNSPTDTPTDIPTLTNTSTPTDAPTNIPTNMPSNIPTDTPTSTPTSPPATSTVTPTMSNISTNTSTPMITATPIPTSTACISTIQSNFNGTAINAGRYIWFNSVLTVSGLGANPATIHVRNGTVQYSANGTNYNLTVPDADITFSSAITTPSTTFDTINNRWITQVPPGLSGNTFLAGLAFPVSTALPGGINPVSWSGRFTTDTPGVSINWKWAAAVYTQFSSNYNAVGVKPADGAGGSDHAGTPENYKSWVTGGARGGGGFNYTGSYSGTSAVAPCR